MLYLIGGAAKSGKSYLTKAILKAKHLSFFPTDYLMVGLSDTIEGFTINPEIDRDEDVAKKLEPILLKIMTAVIHNDDDFLFEGVHIRPALYAKLAKQYPNKVKAVFLIYDEISTSEKVEELNKYVKSKTKTWLDLYEGEKFIKVVEILKEESLQLKKECLVNRVPYVEVKNIVKQKQEILNFLFSEK